MFEGTTYHGIICPRGTTCDKPQVVLGDYTYGTTTIATVLYRIHVYSVAIYSSLQLDLKFMTLGHSS